MAHTAIKKKGNKGDLLFYSLLMIWPLLQFAVFYIYVNFNSFLMAFQIPRYDGSGAIDWGFQNFTMFWEELVN